MKIDGSEELYDALEDLPVDGLRTGRVIGEAQHAAMQTAARLGRVIVLVWDDDEEAYLIRALDIDANG